MGLPMRHRPVMGFASLNPSYGPRLADPHNVAKKL
jgi:hypothetical protein